MDVPAIVDMLGRDSDKMLVGRVRIIWFWQRKTILPTTGMSWIPECPFSERKQAKRTCSPVNLPPGHGGLRTPQRERRRAG